MDVTKSNFKSVVADIKTAITNASFLAIDCEFSGLNINNEVNINPYDTYKQYYNKLKRNVNSFLVLQFGLCTFRYDEAAHIFKQKCYNFYIFPRSVNKHVPDKRFTCQASSIDFLINHNFNFNKVFGEGITYINKMEEAKIKQLLDEKQKNRSNTSLTPNNGPNNIIPIPDEEKSFVDDVMSKIEEFLDSTDEERMLPICNAFRRRLIYQTTHEKYGTRVSLETRIADNKDRVLYVLKPETPEKRAEKEQLHYKLQLSEIEDAVGFSTIIQHISDSRKLLVGHNLCLDLMHTIDKFLTPLPEDYEEFKECANCLFPRILDTKIMATSQHFKEILNNTMLNGLLESFKNQPFELPALEIEENSEGYTLNDDRQHEAGYDAFLTGVCFLTMVHYLGKSEDIYSLIKEPESKLLKPYLNKMFILKLQDCPFINLCGKDPTPTRDHVLHITFPKEWKTSEITQLFSPFGNVHVAWLSDRTAYVSLYKRDQASIALRTLSQSDTYNVISYAMHQQQLQKQQTNVIFDRNLKFIRNNSQQSPQLNKKRDASEINTSQQFVETKKRRTNAFFEESTSKQKSEDEKPKGESLVSRMTKMFDENATWE